MLREVQMRNGRVDGNVGNGQMLSKENRGDGNTREGQMMRDGYRGDGHMREGQMMRDGYRGDGHMGGGIFTGSHGAEFFFYIVLSVTVIILGVLTYRKFLRKDK